MTQIEKMGSDQWEEMRFHGGWQLFGVPVCGGGPPSPARHRGHQMTRQQDDELEEAHGWTHPGHLCEGFSVLKRAGIRPPRSALAP